MDGRHERERRRRDWAADLSYDLRHAFRQTPRSPSVTLLLGAAALVAASVPAMRATRVDPAVTLREE